MEYHVETWVSECQLGITHPPYRPSLWQDGQYVDEEHRAIADLPLNGEIIQHPTPGWLRRADALKLYELAALCPGDVLELGAYYGLSTGIIAGAIERYPDGNRRLTTVELNPAAMTAVRANTAAHAGRIEYRQGDAQVICNELIAEGRHFGFAFIDHSHRFDVVRNACHAMKELVRPGGLVLLHDYNDARNGRDPDYGVWQAAVAEFERGATFCGIYGCTGLYRIEI
jgi:predicted O-methyltransferase YrrM